MANPADTANRSVLDQLTAAATAPQGPTPAPDANAAPVSADSGSNYTPPPLISAPATSTGSTADLESKNIAESPSNLSQDIAATKTSEETAHPTFLHQLGRIAAGAMGIQPGELDTPEGKGRAIMSILNKVGTAGTLAMGTPEQKQLAVEQEQIPLKLAQIRNEQDYRKALIANNANKTDILQQNADTKNQATDQQGNLISARVPQIQADTAKKQFELETLKNGMFPVDPVTAQLANNPGLANKAVSAPMWNEINKVIEARGLHVQDLGADGLWVLDRGGNRIHQVSTISPSVARGESYNKSKPQSVLDPTDNTFKIMPAGQAEALGAAQAGIAQTTMAKQAQFKDIYSGVASVRQAVMDLGEQTLSPQTIAKLTLATRETDPTVAHQIIDTIFGSEQLTPQQQNFVQALGQLNERVLSVRNLAGMGNASDSMRAQIRATLPSVKSGNTTMMIKQLNGVQNFIDNLYSGVGNVRTTSTPKPTAGGGTSATPTATPATGGKQSFSDFMAKKGK